MNSIMTSSHTPENTNLHHDDVKLTSNTGSLREYDNYEFVSELFGMLPIDLSDKIYSLHSVVFYRILDGFKQFLNANTTMKSSRKEQLLKKLSPHFDTFIEVSIDRNFNIFQQYLLDNILHVKDDPLLVLDYYKDLNMKLDDSDMKNLDMELEMARNDVRSQMAFKKWIENEKKRLVKSVKILEEYHRQLEFMNSLAKEYNVPELDDALQQLTLESDKLEQQLKTRLEEVFRQGLGET